METQGYIVRSRADIPEEAIEVTRPLEKKRALELAVKFFGDTMIPIWFLQKGSKYTIYRGK